VTSRSAPCGPVAIPVTSTAWECGRCPAGPSTVANAFPGRCEAFAASGPTMMPVTFKPPGWISMQRFRCDLRQGPEPILPLPYTRPPVGNFFALGTGRDEKAGTAARLNRHSEIRILYVFDTGATRSYSWPATRPGGTPGTDIGPGLGHAPRSPQASRRCPGRAASRHRHLAVHRVGASSSNCIDQPVHRAGPAGPVQPASAAITGHHRQAWTLSPGCIGFLVHSVHGHKRSCSDLLSCHGARFAQYVSAGQGCGVGVGFRLRAG
jgi:hypothetical protein